jgi:hypothetical protein
VKNGLSGGPWCSAAKRADVILFAILLLAATPLPAQEELAAYDIVINGTHRSSQVAVDVVVDLPERLAGQTVEFLLASKLKITKSSPKVTSLKDAGAEGFQGINGSSVDLSQRAGVNRYSVQLPADSTRLNLTYRGAIDYELRTQGEEYTRSFQETPGLVSEDGVYLAGSTLWYPYFGDDLVTFKLNAKTDPGWHLISQGDGDSGGEDGLATWDSAGPVDEIYLVGGPLTRYEKSAGAVTAEVYLREPDDALAQKYLDATARYLEMYRGLIGPYPYGKFALVENFWETGYGMPSFTLLGPQIIRFPFILTSSYPHEILHNWWGNSVFVDYDTGNWAEGLTAYMADHLIKEQQGQGAEYRRDTLKKYRDFVGEGRDFPLTEFRSRHSAATEAVGYGKTLMGFHMLRLKMGDDAFRRAMQSFYRKNRNRKASFADVRAALEADGELDLERFFTDWVERAGAADLDLADVRVAPGGKGYVTTGRLLQRQPQEPYALDVPIAVVTSNGTAMATIRSEQRETGFSINTRNPPQLLSVDPEFDLFRLLDARETAPSIGQVFGESEITAVLPADADEAERNAYEALVAGWESPAQKINRVLDSEVTELPADQAVWLFGAGNRLVEQLFPADGIARVSRSDDALDLAGEQLSFAGTSTVAMNRHPANPGKAVGWITVGTPAAFEGMGRKLPHYGKYSYLAFTGDEPENFLKGEWTATDSPLLVDLRPDDARDTAVAVTGLPKRSALAEMPQVFSSERMMETVDWLAAPEREGRGLGSQGLEDSAEYIAAQFAEIGLEPAGDDGGYLQTFTVDTGPDGGPNTVHNVIGYIPGSDPQFDGQAVLITAHYDHLGYGWPDERAQAEPGATYVGADDNASGIAVLLELARACKDGATQPRSLVFVALTGEEAGLLGSQYYVDHPTPTAIDGIFAVINMDTVGRLGDQPVSILATESATEWAPVFRGVGFTTGIPVETVPGASESSDQQSFINQGIAGIQVFTGAHLDYHRPSDTPDKVDAAGMVKVATVVKETATYLSERAEPLTVTGAGRSTGTSEQTQASASGERRRVSFGTVPDFAHQGPGVGVESVIPGSGAAQAGIQAGDVITSINGEEVADLGAFSGMLKRFSPGDVITATGSRDGETYEVELELQAR